MDWIEIIEPSRFITVSIRDGEITLKDAEKIAKIIAKRYGYHKYTGWYRSVAYDGKKAIKIPIDKEFFDQGGLFIKVIGVDTGVYFFHFTKGEEK